MNLTTWPDRDAAATACAEILAGHLRAALLERPTAHLALNGGSTPRPVYERLPGLLEDWSGVHVWFGDERCVPPDDEASNFRLAAETVIAGAGLPPDRVHRMRGELGPAEGAKAYAAELAEHLELDDAGIPVLDVVHLGLGPDGHTASLFPGHPALRVSGWATVGVDDSPKPPPERISLSLACLNAARARVLHVVGEDKAEALARTLGAPTEQTPASLLERDRLDVVADEPATTTFGDVADG
ncbi:MAG: 6-phosphogluconolactonase [Solirubrobacterales bacterium]|nr:6-phosphogluconolactonase [Solirubrobacterales bacterium]